MATAAMQQAKAKRDKRTSQFRLMRLLIPWRQEIVSGYRLGAETSDRDAVPILTQSLRTNYIATFKDVLQIDIRQYKQDEEGVADQVFRTIGFTLTGLYASRAIASSRSVTNTASGWVKRTSELARENSWTEAEARIILNNYLQGQINNLTLTESQWAVETARRVSVVRVKDPLKNSVEQISRLFEIGDNNGARQLARKVAKLARLPLSLKEGQIVRNVAALRSASIGPLQQAQRLASIRQRAEELDRNTKTWRTIGDNNVRDTHDIINGQTQKVDAPFELVMGIVQYPGDGSLGAPMIEIAGCRCTAVYN